MKESTEITWGQILGVQRLETWILLAYHVKRCSGAHLEVQQVPVLHQYPTPNWQVSCPNYLHLDYLRDGGWIYSSIPSSVWIVKISHSHN